MKYFNARVRPWGSVMGSPLGMAIAVSAVFFSVYLAGLLVFKPLYMGFDIFSADSAPIFNYVADRITYQDAGNRPDLHQLLPLMRFAARGVDRLVNDRELSTTLVFAGVAALNAFLACLAFRWFTRDRWLSLCLSLVYGFSFANLLFFSIPETYVISSCALLLFSACLIRLRGDALAVRSIVLLAFLAGLAAANNLPLISLLIPLFFVISERAAGAPRKFALGAGALAVAAGTFFAIDHLCMHDKFFPALNILVDGRSSFLHFADRDAVSGAFLTFLFYVVVSPCRNLGEGPWFLAQYLWSYTTLALFCMYLYLLIVAARSLIKGRDRLLIGFAVWWVAMLMGYIYLSPRESFLYSSQIVFPLLLIVSKGVQESTHRYKALFMAAFAALLVVANLYCMYRPSPVESHFCRWSQENEVHDVFIPLHRRFMNHTGVVASGQGDR